MKNHFYSTLRRQLRKILRKVLNNQEAEPEEVNVDYLKKIMKDYNVDYSEIDNPNVRSMMKRLNGLEDKTKPQSRKRATRKYELYYFRTKLLEGRGRQKEREWWIQTQMKMNPIKSIKHLFLYLQNQQLMYLTLA